MRLYKILCMAIFPLFSIQSLAEQVLCDDSYLNRNNHLWEVTVYNAKNIYDKNIFVLAPTKEIETKTTVKQFWELTPYRDMKIFVTCTYKNKDFFTKEITNDFDICQLTFLDPYKIISFRQIDMKPKFICNKK